MNERITCRQASFNESSTGNLKGKLPAPSAIVAVVPPLFPGNWRVTAMSLIAIPAFLLVTILVFSLIGLSINIMTPGCWRCNSPPSTPAQATISMPTRPNTADGALQAQVIEAEGQRHGKPSRLPRCRRLFQQHFDQRAGYPAATRARRQRFLEA